MTSEEIWKQGLLTNYFNQPAPMALAGEPAHKLDHQSPY